MGEYGLPCIVCDIALKNEFPKQVENQPRDGVVCKTRGNYGSTAWDATDGSVLEFNVCDECLVKAGEKGHVLVGRPTRPALTIRNLVIGHEHLNRPYVEWRKGVDGGFGPHDVLEVSTVEDFDELNGRNHRGRFQVEWLHPPEEVRRLVEHHWNEQVEQDNETTIMDRVAKAIIIWDESQRMCPGTPSIFCVLPDDHEGYCREISYCLRNESEE